MRKIARLFPFILVTIWLSNSTATAQTEKVKSSFVPQDTALYRAITHMDSVMFDAFNQADLETLKKVFATSLEFYHDTGGMNGYESSMESFKNLFKNVPGLKRELVPGSLEVYPIPNYGAVEIGQHRFIHVENGKQVVATYKFIHTWQFKDGVWKATRVISVGH